MKDVNAIAKKALEYKEKGLSEREIADELHLSPETVTWLLTRGVKGGDRRRPRHRRDRRPRRRAREQDGPRRLGGRAASRTDPRTVDLICARGPANGPPCMRQRRNH